MTGSDETYGNSTKSGGNDGRGPIPDQQAPSPLGAEEVARLIKTRFDVHIEIDPETSGEKATERQRPLTPQTVQKLLDRLHYELTVESGPDGVRVVGDHYHLVLTPVALKPDHGSTIDLINLLSVPALDPTPQAAVANAARIALFRQQLLETGAVDYAAIAEGRLISRDAARKFVERSRKRHQLIAVRYNEHVYVPILLLDEAFEANPAYRPLIELLHAAGETGWAAWTYLATPSRWLDGAVPGELVVRDPEAVIEATRRRLSNRAA